MCFRLLAPWQIDAIILRIVHREVHCHSSCVKSKVYTAYVLFLPAQSVLTHMYTIRHQSMGCMPFRHWRSAVMETSMWTDTPAGCENCWCPAVRQWLPSHLFPERRSKATPRHPISRSVPGESVGRGCYSPLCWPARRVAVRRSCHQSRPASAQNSRPDASTSSPRPPRCCRRSSACGWSSPGSRREALWGSGLERGRRSLCFLLQ